MRQFLLLLTLSFLVNLASAQIPPIRYEKTMGKQTPEYSEIIDWWKKIDAASGKVKMLTMGLTDAGFPLHLVVVGNNGDANFENIRKNNKRVFLINNGIHPGEPDGIDASMILVRDIITNMIKLPDNIVLAIIPVYNIGGSLNRSSNYRVDQNGPEEFGFRGNAQNLDLNRDFIKSDSRNARSFAEIFHLVKPDVFLDNHVSNGADYQHVMTLIATQHNKLGGETGLFMNKSFEPGIYASMKKKGYDLIPYVNAFGDTPENGWPEFFDGPRYGSGYGALWHCFSFVAETHMLKPYSQRVDATLELMKSFIDFISQNSNAIKSARDKDFQTAMTQTEFPITWKLDRSQYSERLFRGFQAGYKPSEVSGLPRLYYDRSKPFDAQIKFYNYYVPDILVKKPTAYILPQGWWPVVDLLKINGVRMVPLKKDTVIEVSVYRIDEYKSGQRPYESHHVNSDVKTSVTRQKMKFRKGDLYIPMNQMANRFLIETLEPRAPDSYFAWNFFDGILGQKEGYSGYVFEETAAAYLKEYPKIREQLEARKQADSNFAKSGRAQLNFVYENSKYFEPDYLRYPVYRVE